MIEDLADLWSFSPADCDARCITTNGSVKANGRAVMGRGVARQAKDRYLGLAIGLGAALRQGGNHVGVLAMPPAEPILVMFPVKHEWHELADLDLIVQSARELVLLTEERGWARVVLPRPGCGSGGRSWGREVRPRLQPILDERFLVVTL